MSAEDVRMIYFYAVRDAWNKLRELDAKYSEMEERQREIEEKMAEPEETTKETKKKKGKWYA